MFNMWINKQWRLYTALRKRWTLHYRVTDTHNTAARIQTARVVGPHQNAEILSSRITRNIWRQSRARLEETTLIIQSWKPSQTNRPSKSGTSSSANLHARPCTANCVPLGANPGIYAPCGRSLLLIATSFLLLERHNKNETAWVLIGRNYHFILLLYHKQKQNRAVILVDIRKSSQKGRQAYREIFIIYPIY